MTGFFDRLKNIAKTLFRHGGLIYTPIAILAFFAPVTAHADVQQGLSVTVWDNYTGQQGQFNNAPPIPPTTSICLETTWSNLIYNFGNNPVCGIYDDFVVNINGYITAPETGTYTLYMHGDDGVKLYLDDSIIVDAWYDSGNAGATAEVEFTEGVSKSLTAWYYENGGGAQVRLDYLVNGQWVPVPDSWFSQNIQTPPTTTTTLPPYLNPVTNLIAVAKPDGSVDLGWDAPTASNVDIYAYSVSFYDLDEIGGTTSGGWGVWTNQGTIYSLAEYMFSGSNPVTTGYGPVRFGIKAGNQSCFSNEGVGPCVYGPEVTVDATVFDPTPPTTTTPEIPETTTTWVPDTTSTVPPTTSITTVPIETVPVTTEAPTTEAPTETTIAEEPETTPTTEAEVPVETSAPEPEQEGPDSTVPESTEPPETTPTTSEAPIEVPEDVQDASDEAVADIFDTPISNEELAGAVDDLVADADTPEELTAVVNSLLDQELTDSQFATVIDSVFSEPLSDENFDAAVDAVFEDPTQLSEAQFEDAVTAVFDGPLSDEQFQDAVTAVFEDTESLSDEQFDSAVQAVFDEPLSTEQFAEVLDAVFDEPVSDEKFDSIISAVLDEPISDEQFEELVNVLESDTVTEEQVSSAVDSVIENGVTEDQAVDLATSAKVLESIDGEQATEIFDAVDISAVSEEEAAQLIEAVQDAPTEVKESFETEINIFEGAVDTYVPLGSSISVGGRRVVVAVSAVIVIAPAPIISRRR